MNKTPRYQDLSDEQLRSIHGICEAFEKELRAGHAVRIEDRIASVGNELRQHLFPDLLAIELEVRSPAPTEDLISAYISRFPEFPDEIRQVVREMGEFVGVQLNAPFSSTGVSEAGQQTDRVFKEGTAVSDRYTLEQKIGEGGMGEVWIANQTSPVQRKVAIKLIKTGMDSRQVIARFEQERQALAMMDHPNIARVFDAGRTSTGIPFFVMEWVDGLPLDQFCDNARLTPVERLEIFVSICQAVQHAHQKGIIHRDLKPSNIVIGDVDGKAMPKVIDFGVAKATGGQPTDGSLATGFGNVVGTLAYMSPEQAGFPVLDVDTRSDIYSLGVILYELLTGLRPIDTRSLQGAGLAEMVRLIQEQEPSRPSTKLSSNESSVELASDRSIDPKKLTSLLRGELDWIVMKCLEKNRDRRYESASALARDIQRFLIHEPVEARPPSSGYLLAKFFRRHKGPVIATAAVFLVLLAGIAGTSFGLLRAERARIDAVKAQQAEAEQANGERIAKLEARKQTTLALASAANEKAARIQTQKRLGQIEKSNQILASIFNSLSPREIAESKYPLQAILVDKLETAAQQLEGDSIGDPVVVAKMQGELGLSLLALSAPEQALVLFQKSYETFEAQLGPNDEATAVGLHNLAEGQLANGHPDLAIPMFKDALRRQTAIFGDNNRMVATAKINLARAYVDDGNYDRAVPLLTEAVSQMTSILGSGHPETLSSIAVLAVVLQDAGQPLDALDLLEETCEQQKITNGLNHPDTLASLTRLADGYRSIGSIDRAMPLYEQTLELTRATLGENHHLTLSTMGSMACLYKEVGQTEIALPIFKERLKRTRSEYGPDHPRTLQSMSDLASGYQAAGERELAFSLCKETLAGMKAKLKPRHPATLTCMGNLAAIYQDTGKIEQALPLFEEALELEKAKLGANHPNTLRTMNNLAVAYWATQQLDKSVPMFRELVDQLTSLLGPDHPNTLMTIVNLGVNLKDSGQLEKSLPKLEQGYRAGQRFPGLRAIAGPQLLDGYAQAENTESAIKVATEIVDAMRNQAPAESPELAKFLEQTGISLLQAKAYSRAKEMLDESLAIRRNAESVSWRIFHLESLVGGTLLGQEKYPEAESLLVSGYVGMKKLEQLIPQGNESYLVDALKRLIECHEATGDKENAAIRRAELERE